MTVFILSMIVKQWDELYMDSKTLDGYKYGKAEWIKVFNGKYANVKTPTYGNRKQDVKILTIFIFINSTWWKA